jgi:hypothetical protein
MRIWTTTELKKARKLHRRREYAGLRVSVETQTGAYRHWHDPHSGQRGKTRMLYDYGYIRGSLGTDGDHVDVYLGPNEKAPMVYIVDQAKKPAGSRAGDGMPWVSFDEQKVMMGFDSSEAAKRAYLAHYDDPRFLLSIRPMPVGEFREKVTSKLHHGYVIKGSHKYVERHPDGKGGWRYVYPNDRGPHADAQKHLTPAAQKPGAKACMQCKGRGKVVSRQPDMFGGPEAVSSATCRRCKGKGVER